MPTTEMPPMSMPISMVAEQESTFMSPSRNFFVYRIQFSGRELRGMFLRPEVGGEFHNLVVISKPEACLPE